MKISVVVLVALLNFLQVELLSQGYVHILTYNIRYDNPSDGLDSWSQRKSELSSYVFNGKHSILGLQEVLHHQLLYLDSTQRQYDHYGVGRDDGFLQGEYAPVFWNKAEFSMESTQTKWLSETPDVPSKGWDAACIRIATLVQLRHKSTGKRWGIINTHWDHVGQEARLQSAQLIAKWASVMNDSCDVVVIMGDFNATPSDSALESFDRVFQRTANEIALKQSTFNGFQPYAKENMHIDDIYTLGALKSMGYVIDEPKTKSNRQLSDHFPVRVTLQAQ